MLENLHPDSGLNTCPADDIRADSPEDALRIPDDQVGVLLHSGDGALVIGTREQLRAYFRRIAELRSLRALPTIIDGETGEPRSISTGRPAETAVASPDKRGCSCGMADYGAPGHDGGPDFGGHQARENR